MFQGRSCRGITPKPPFWTISSAEIESTLPTHDAVLEAAVIAVPDEDRGNIARAYVQVNREPSDELANELKQFVKDQLGKFEYPREVEFLDEIPKTVGGKTDRKKLKDMAGVG